MKTALEALERIKNDMEYVTRLDFVEPIVRGQVQEDLYKIYHREEKDLDLIEKSLKTLEIIKAKEEEYGFSLLIYHEALKNGIWHKEGNLIEPVYDVCLDREGLFFPYINSCGNLDQIRFSPKDFNITWALQRGDLINKEGELDKEQ